MALVRPGSVHKNHLLAGVDSVLAELTDKQSLTSAVSQAGAVIYCAGSVRGRQLEDFTAANIDGVRSVVEAMNDLDGEVPLLLVSSLAANRPKISDYANSKYLGEQEVRRYARFPWTVFRPPAVYGPGDKEMLPILKMARKGLITRTGPKDQRVSLIHADDLASAILAWLGSWHRCSNQVFTLHDGHENGYDWREIAETAGNGNYRIIPIPACVLFGVAGINRLASRLFGYAPMLTPGKARELTQPDWVCNNRALSEATGWAPSITLEKGLLSLLGSF